MQFKQLRNETSLLHHNLLFCGIHSVIKGRNAVTLVFQFETGEAYMSIMVQLSKTSPPGPCAFAPHTQAGSPAGLDSHASS